MTMGEKIDQLCEESKQHGEFEMLINLIDGQIITLSQAAEQAGISEDEFMVKLEKYRNLK